MLSCAPIMIILAVPYNEKDQAKALGALWHPQIKVWYYPTLDLPAGLLPWVCKPNGQENHIIESNLYLLSSFEQCWSCGELVPVFALGAFIHKKFSIFSEISAIPLKINELICQSAPSFYYDVINKNNKKYYINHCLCGVKISETSLHRRGGAFSPRDEGHCNTVKVTLLINLNNSIDSVALLARVYRPKLLTRYIKANQLRYI